MLLVGWGLVAQAQVVFSRQPRALPAGVLDARFVVVGDLDADGLPDAVFDDHRQRLGWYAGTATGFGWRGVVAEAVLGPLQLVDLEGDGDLDLLLGQGGAAVNDGLGGFALVPLDASGAVAGDVDGDGDPDLLAWGAVHPNLGALQFGPGRPFPEDGVVLLADMDGDGDPDVQGSHGTYLGDGSGGFSTVETLVDTYVVGAATIDMDGDGDLDLLRRKSYLPLEWVENLAPGLGAITPLPGTELPPSDSGTLTAVDVDGDGVPDVVEPGGRVTPGLSGGGIGVATRWADPACEASAAIDVDHDGAPDLLCAENASGYAAPRRPAWYRSAGFPDQDRDGLSDVAEARRNTSSALPDTDGDGLGDAAEVAWGTDPLDPADAGTIDRDHDTLSDATEGALGTDPARGDTDGDGLFDAVEPTSGTDPLAPDTDGDGAADGQERRCGTDPLRPASTDTDCDGLGDRGEATRGTDPTAADTDGDGLTDGDEVHVHGSDPLAVDTDGGGVPDGEDVRRGGDPTDPLDDWTSSSMLSVEWHGDVVTGDSDVDGDDDVWVGELEFENVSGAFAYRYHGGLAPYTEAVAVEDVDRDGAPDVVLGRPGTAELAWSQGPVYAAPSPLPVATARVGREQVVVADADADGDPDALTGGWWAQQAGPFPSFVNLAENQGNGAFVLTEDWVVPAFPPAMLLVGDLEGDGRRALVLSDGPNLETWDLGGAQPALAWAAPLVDPATDYTVNGEHLVDLDGDGDLDLVYAVIDGGGYDDGVWRRKDLGNGVFAAPVRIAPHVDQVAVGDVDLDGDPDLVVADGDDDSTWGAPDEAYGRGVSVLENDATGRFARPRLLISGPLDEVRSLRLSDLDGDGDLDVVVASSSTPSVEWLENPIR